MGQNLLQQITTHTCHPGAWLQAAVVKRGEGCYVNKPFSAGSFWANHRPEFLFDRVCAPPGCEGETSWQAGDSETSPDASLRRGTSASGMTRREKCGLESRERLCRKGGTVYKPEVHQELPGLPKVRPWYCTNQKQASKPKNAMAVHDHSSGQQATGQRTQTIPKQLPLSPQPDFTVSGARVKNAGTYSQPRRSHDVGKG